MSTDPSDGADGKNSAVRRPTQATIAILAAVLLGVAAVLTAWSAYRASLTSDLILKNYSEQQATIATANDYLSRADQQEALERSLFLEWALANSLENYDAAAYIAEVMTDELYSAVDWWAQDASEPSPATPFVEENPYFADLESQVLIAEGTTLYEEADALRQAAEIADANSDRFDLANVFFAIVLFVAGMATIVHRRSIQVGFLSLSVAGLVAGVFIVVTTSGWANLN